MTLSMNGRKIRMEIHSSWLSLFQHSNGGCQRPMTGGSNDLYIVAITCYKCGQFMESTMLLMTTTFLLSLLNFQTFWHPLYLTQLLNMGKFSASLLRPLQSTVMHTGFHWRNWPLLVMSSIQWKRWESYEDQPVNGLLHCTWFHNSQAAGGHVVTIDTSTMLQIQTDIQSFIWKICPQICNSRKWT